MVITINFHAPLFSLSIFDTPQGNFGEFAGYKFCITDYTGCIFPNWRLYNCPKGRISVVPVALVTDLQALGGRSKDFYLCAFKMSESVLAVSFLSTN